jgi:uncharacterized protein YjiS (DUF1127 family)
MISIKAIRFTDFGKKRIFAAFTTFLRTTTMSDLMMTHFIPLRRSASRSVLGHWLAALRRAARVAFTRQDLPHLSARALADIGLTQEAALAEAARLPWDATPRFYRYDPHGAADHVQAVLERARKRRLVARAQAQADLISKIG